MSLTAEQERVLGRQSAAATASDAAAAAAAVSSNPGVSGQWSAKQPWPVVGVHMALMPDGKVLAYDSVGDNATERYATHDTTRSMLWDSATGASTLLDPNIGFNLFCSGLAHLMDGRLYIAGGNKDQQLGGLAQTHVFDAATGRFTREADMAVGRWYPSVTPLGDGQTLITSGRIDTATNDVALVPEVRRVDGQLRRLSSASKALPLYPWMDVAPSGKTFYSGPDPDLETLDTTGTGEWNDVGRRNDGVERSYGGHALYDIGRTLVAGGGRPPLRSSELINTSSTTPTSTASGNMEFARRQNNLTVLADGSVLTTGGLSSDRDLVDVNAGVYNAERWDPRTGAWTTLAAAEASRQYHSGALLLPDGRVLTAGGGICGPCDTDNYHERNAEIFSPPYLFKPDGSPAPRPVIAGAPGAATWGGALPIDSPSAASVTKVALVRLGAVTHSVNMEQRYVPLSFQTSGTRITAIGPAGANVAPPGYYMLFLVDANGVPSVSTMVRVQADTPPSVVLTGPADGATVIGGATITATAADADDTVAKVEFFDGTEKISEDTTEPYSASWSAAPGPHSLTVKATDGLGFATTSAARLVTAVAPNQAPTIELGVVGGGSKGSPGAPQARNASLTSPARPMTLTAPARVTLTATAADPDGRVVKVQFFRGSTPIAQDTSAPWAYAWSKVGAGSYTLTARATDDRGAVATSAPVKLTVRRPLVGSLSVAGRTSRSRRVAFTTSKKVRVTVILGKRRGRRWVPLRGKRTVTVKAGRHSTTLGRWGGRRLTAGRYRVVLRAGSVAASATFTVR